MLPESAIRRTIEISPTLIVELDVAESTTMLWAPELLAQRAARHALAAGRALREAYDLLEARGIVTGRCRWRATRVEIEPA